MNLEGAYIVNQERTLELLKELFASIDWWVKVPAEHAAGLIGTEHVLEVDVLELIRAHTGPRTVLDIVSRAAVA